MPLWLDEQPAAAKTAAEAIKLNKRILVLDFILEMTSG
jgi:hypothetical protein